MSNIGVKVGLVLLVFFGCGATAGLCDSLGEDQSYFFPSTGLNREEPAPQDVSPCSGIFIPIFGPVIEALSGQKPCVESNANGPTSGVDEGHQKPRRLVDQNIGTAGRRLRGRPDVIGD